MANADNPWKHPEYYVASEGLNIFEILHNILLLLPISNIQYHTLNTLHFL